MLAYVFTLEDNSDMFSLVHTYLHIGQNVAVSLPQSLLSGLAPGLNGYRIITSVAQNNDRVDC